MIELEKNNLKHISSISGGRLRTTLFMSYVGLLSGAAAMYNYMAQDQLNFKEFQEFKLNADAFREFQ